MVAVETAKPKVGKVALNLLKRDYKYYPRESVDYATVERFKNAMKAGARFPPLRVCSKSMRIIDGFHRYTAYQELNVETVDAIPVDVANDREFFIQAVEANSAHGLGYSPIDHSKIIKIARLLRLDREKISLAMAIPISRYEDLARMVPESKPGEAQTPLVRSNAHRNQSGYQTYERAKALASDKIATSGYAFHFNQVIKFFTSGLFDPANETMLAKVKDVEAIVTKYLDPEVTQHRVYCAIEDGCYTVSAIAVETHLPADDVKEMIDALLKTKDIEERKQGATDVSHGPSHKLYVVRKT